MIKLISLALIIITSLLAIQFTAALKYEYTNLDLGSQHLDHTIGSETKFYTISIDSNLLDNDLLIDSKITSQTNDFYESPLLLISTVRNLSNNIFIIESSTQPGQILKMGLQPTWFRSLYRS